VSNRKDSLEYRLSEFSLEALITTIDDYDELMKALKTSHECCSIFKRQT